MSEDIDDHVVEQYEIKKRLGKGAYGIVWKAVDKRDEKIVALKKIFDAFRNQTDAQRTFREIMFLRAFGDHPNIVKLDHVLRAHNDKDIYLVFEYMDTDLHNVIKRGGILKDVHKQYILYQILRALKYLHSANVIHRDLKPSNILLDSNCAAKLADFGLARSLQQLPGGQNSGDSGDFDGLPELTEYVATRWYRAPEILLAARRYTMGVDMWSAGAVLAEMLLGKALFPGTSTINQIERIVAMLPTPSKQDVTSIGSMYAATVIEKITSSSSARQRPCGGVGLLDVCLTGAPHAALDLIGKLLVFNPWKRLTVDEALRHPYMAPFHDPGDEPSMGRDVVLPLSDDVQLSVGAYRARLYQLLTGIDSTVEAKKSQMRRIARDPLKQKQQPIENHPMNQAQNGKKFNGHAVVYTENAKERIESRSNRPKQAPMAEPECSDTDYDTCRGSQRRPTTVRRHSTCDTNGVDRGVPDTSSPSTTMTNQRPSRTTAIGQQQTNASATSSFDSSMMTSSHNRPVIQNDARSSFNHRHDNANVGTTSWSTMGRAQSADARWKKPTATNDRPLRVEFSEQPKNYELKNSNDKFYYPINNSGNNAWTNAKKFFRSKSKDTLNFAPNQHGRNSYNNGNKPKVTSQTHQKTDFDYSSLGQDYGRGKPATMGPSKSDNFLSSKVLSAYNRQAQQTSGACFGRVFQPKNFLTHNSSQKVFENGGINKNATQMLKDYRFTTSKDHGVVLESDLWALRNSFV